MAIATPQRTRSDVLREELRYIAEELFAREHRSGQVGWQSEVDCPWCIRLAAAGIVDEDCDICGQVALNAAQPAIDVAQSEPHYLPDHHRSPMVKINIRFPVGMTFREKGKQHGVGAEQGTWDCEITMQHRIPKDGPTRREFAVELANHLVREMREQPFRTGNGDG